MFAPRLLQQVCLIIICLAMSAATKFRVSEKIPEKYQNEAKDLDGQTLKNLQNLTQYEANHCTEILMGSNFGNKTRLAKRNGFVDTVISCYNGHHNLIIRPDDIWTAIMTQFSFYINKNAEEFRKKFVDFEGKKELRVSVGGSLRSAPYDVLVKLMSEKIHENLVDPKVKSWILPNFSTTTDDDVVSCGVVFMATMKKYFDYVMELMCGIPFVTLEGTLEDWQNILERLEKLKEYKLKNWYTMLQPILFQFVEAKKGNVDVDFWSRICNVRSFGSGSREVSGWITAFCVFDKDGNWQGNDRVEGSESSLWPKININNIPTGIVEVDVKIDDNGQMYNSTMFAGHMAFEIVDDNTLKPKIGWAIALKPSQEEIEKIEAKIQQNELMKTSGVSIHNWEYNALMIGLFISFSCIILTIIIMLIRLKIDVQQPLQSHKNNKIR